MLHRMTGADASSQKRPVQNFRILKIPAARLRHKFQSLPFQGVDKP